MVSLQHATPIIHCYSQGLTKHGLVPLLRLAVVGDLRQDVAHIPGWLRHITQRVHLADDPRHQLLL